MKNVKVVIFQDSPEQPWVAVGLDYYIAAQASSPHEVLQEFVRMLEAEVAISSHFDFAPKEYWNMFETAKPFSAEKFALDYSLEVRIIE